MFLFPVLLSMVLTASQSQAEILRNDGYEDGGTVYFQAGFVTGETAAVRLTPALSGPQLVEDVHFLLGGATTQVTITLNIWRDSGGAAPGVLLFTNDYLVQGSNDVFSSMDLTGQGIDADGGIWVGIQFQHSGYPSVCRDDDGIVPDRNYIDADGLGWVEAGLLGVPGDWVIRATVADVTSYTVGGSITDLNGALVLQNNGSDDLIFGADGPFVFPAPIPEGSTYDVTVLSEPTAQDCYIANGSGAISGSNVTDVLVTCIDESSVVGNDSWEPGQNQYFQAGFAPGEIAAARLTPAVTGLRRLKRVLFLFGGQVTNETVRLHVWADDAGTTEPGIELFAADYQITGSNALQSIDLSAHDIQIADSFRIGLGFTHFGLPSVSRDDDGITANRNFIFDYSSTWYESSVFGLTGDWIIRAVDEPVDSFEIISVADLPNDQGRQVRITWEASSMDSPGSSQPITDYAIFRRIDDGSKSDASASTGDVVLAYPPGDWDFLLTVPAFEEASYSTIIPTVADSTITVGMRFSVFFVRAMTVSAGTYYDTPPDSGYSVDNLVPQAPQGFSADYSGGGGVDLSWEVCPDGDFDYFKIYRGDAHDFVIDPGYPLHMTTGLGWHDPAGSPGNHYRVSTVDFSGNESEAASPGVVSEAGGLPLGAVLAQNHPNPFNPATTIGFELATRGDLRLGIFDSRGAVVRILVSGPREAGVHEIRWDGYDEQGRPASSGVYYYRLKVGNETCQTRRMTLVR